MSAAVIDESRVGITARTHCCRMPLREPALGDRVELARVEQVEPAGWAAAGGS